MPIENRRHKLKSASGYVSKNGCEWDLNPCPHQRIYFQIWCGSFHSSRKGLLAWLFWLGTEQRRVHWCLLCLMTRHVAFGFTL